MNNAFNIEVVRSITQSAGRFIAIVVISLLGAGFYAGLRMAAPDMRLGGDEFFDSTNMYDISVVSTLGLDDESLDALAAVDGVGEVMGAYRADAMVESSGGSYAAAIESLPVAAIDSDTSDGMHAYSPEANYLNRPILVEGSWPSTVDECVVGFEAVEEGEVRIGERIELVGDVDELDETFKRTEFTVVGTVNSPMYISTEQMGTTEVGSGSIEWYLYVPSGAFVADLPYAVAYLTVPAAYGAVWDSASYDEAVGVVKRKVEDAAGDIAEQRYQVVKSDTRLRFAEIAEAVVGKDDLFEGVEYPSVYVLDRTKNAGAESLSSDAEGITQIAAYLPFMFFLVSALVVLTSMTRMVDEERLEIGTHKALGYGKARITSKYLVYGALASGLGSIAGIVALGKLLPWFILTSYAVSYDVPMLPVPIDGIVAAKAFGLSVGITLVSTGASAVATLRERPAALMLPRVPKAGKRIILERIHPIWKRMSFSHKVTARNLLRYKRRFFMAVVGVAGCTALLMVGFGLRDAIGGIVENQYVHLMRYDAVVTQEDGASRDDEAALQRRLESDDVEAMLSVNRFNMVARAEGDDMRIEAIVPSDLDSATDFVTLRNRESSAKLELSPGSLVLTEKAATQLGAQVGDTVMLYDENEVGDRQGDGHAFILGGIAENYLGHYAYLSPETYEDAFEETPDFDTVYLKLREGIDKAAFAADLQAIGGVSTVSFTADKIASYEDMLAIMDKLIIVIVLLSAALAFVVLYNLTNINIGERIREIATLKVLGFTRREVYAYIFREVLVMSFIGALVGCVLGVPLTAYIAEAAETAVMMFGRTIEPASYLLSFAITMVFAVLVVFLMRGKLAKIDMVESLKSVE